MKKLACASLLLLLTAVTQADTPSFDPAKEGILVFGLEPGDLVVEISRGHINGREHWQRKLKRDFSGTATLGYVVMRVPADTVLGIVSITPADGSRAPYYWCGANFTPTFSVPAGHVVYFAHFTYKWPPGLLPYFTYTPDLDAARAFLAANHPTLSDKLEQGSFRSRLTTIDCRAMNGPQRD